MSSTWAEDNQRYVEAAIHRIRDLLRRYIAKEKAMKGRYDHAGPAAGGEGHPPSLVTLSDLFGLSEFEESLLLLCAAVELDAETAQLCAKAQGNPNMVQPTFGLALGAFPNAHWSALAPSSPLRRFRLIDLGSTPTLLTATPLRIEERILHYIMGLSYSDTQLGGAVRSVKDTGPLVDSHRAIVGRIVQCWNASEDRAPVVQLWGSSESSRLAIAEQACAEKGLGLHILSAESAPTKPEELEAFSQLWAREAALLGSGLYISAEDVEPAAQKMLRQLLNGVPRPTFLGTRNRWALSDISAVSFEVGKPEKEEQFRLWKACLGEALGRTDDQAISRLVSQFDLDAHTIRVAANDALSLEGESSGLYDSLWRASRAATAPRMAELAERINTGARMDDLVLPEREKQTLKEIAIHVAQRNKVYVEWGFGTMKRGLGVTALFTGDSGTGKTLAAEVLANELNLDLFRIDLSTVVSKYIGETEKNLRRVFDGAEDGGAILFFDEADALFGRRSEVRDSHDRYANIEVGYLLQRMESYHGLAILATNMKAALDPAFIRRITFVVNFPFPDEKSRTEIWKHVFPPYSPTEDLQIDSLARLNITGGHIRNIALCASFLAANEGVAVGMKHLKHAAKAEFAKLELPLTQANLGDLQ